MDAKRFVIIGGILNSALYVIFCFVVGLVEHYRLTECLAVATAGFTYLAYLAMVCEASPGIVGAATLLSTLVGIADGVSIL